MDLNFVDAGVPYEGTGALWYQRHTLLWIVSITRITKVHDKQWDVPDNKCN